MAPSAKHLQYTHARYHAAARRLRRRFSAADSCRRPESEAALAAHLQAEEAFKMLTLDLRDFARSIAVTICSCHDTPERRFQLAGCRNAPHFLDMARQMTIVPSPMLPAATTSISEIIAC